MGTKVGKQLGTCWHKVGRKDWEHVGKRFGIAGKWFGTGRQKVGNGWEQVGTRLGTGWEKVGNKLGTGWKKVGNKLRTSWEKVGTSWGDVENRKKLWTSSETLGKELGNGCERVGRRIILLQRFFLYEWKSSCCEGLAGLALCVVFVRGGALCRDFPGMLRII